MDIFTVPWLLTVAVVLLAAFVRGVAGFGLALILAPILVHLLNPADAVAINLFLGLLSNMLVLSYSFRKVNLKSILPMVISCFFGIPIGTWIITVASPSILKILIGGVTVLFAIPLVLGFSKTLKREKLFGSISGFLSGILASSTSLGGPPVVIFMHSRNWKKETIHPSLATYFSFLNISALAALAVSGLLKTPTVINAVSLAPALLLGTGFGILVFRKMNTRYFRWFSLAIVICAGILGILSGIGDFA